MWEMFLGGASLALMNGDNGTLTLVGVLDLNTLVPTIDGKLAP